MDSTTLSLYLVAVAAVMVTPGPTMLLALSNGATRPMRVAACGIAGAALSFSVAQTAGMIHAIIQIGRAHV